MIEKLEGRDIVSTHKIGKKINEIIDVINSAEDQEDSKGEE